MSALKVLFVGATGIISSAVTRLAVERGNYMAMRSWLESSPPGQDVNVA